MNWRDSALWIAANVAAAVALGFVVCREPLFPPVLPGVIFGAAQTVVLVRLGRALWAWLPVTVAITPAAMFVSGMFIARSIDISFDSPSAEPGQFAQLVGLWSGSIPGWLVASAAQAIVLRVAHLPQAWTWIPAVVVGGAGLVSLGAAAAGPPHDCSAASVLQAAPLGDIRGPVAWVVGGIWYAAATAFALRLITRLRPAPGSG